MQLTTGFRRFAGILWGLAGLLVLASGGVAKAAEDGGRDTIRFGYRVDAPPFSSEQGDELSGYSFELCIAVARQIVEDLDRDFVDATLVKVTADNRFDHLRDREIDVLCGAATITADRRKFMSFSIPIYEDGVGFAVSTEASGPLKAIANESFTTDMLIRSPSLKGMVFGVLENTTTAEFLEQSELSAVSERPTVFFTSHRDAIEALSDQRIDVYFASDAILHGLVRNENWPILLSDEKLTYEPIALGLPRNAPDLSLLVDRALSELYKSGQIYEIYERHFGEVDERTRDFFRRNTLR